MVVLFAFAAILVGAMKGGSWPGGTSWPPSYGVTFDEMMSYNQEAIPSGAEELRSVLCCYHGRDIISNIILRRRTGDAIYDNNWIKPCEEACSGASPLHKEF